MATGGSSRTPPAPIAAAAPPAGAERAVREPHGVGTREERNAAAAVAAQPAASTGAPPKNEYQPAGTRPLTRRVQPGDCHRPRRGAPPHINAGQRPRGCQTPSTSHGPPASHHAVPSLRTLGPRMDAETPASSEMVARSPDAPDPCDPRNALSLRPGTASARGGRSAAPGTASATRRASRRPRTLAGEREAATRRESITATIASRARRRNATSPGRDGPPPAKPPVARRPWQELAPPGEHDPLHFTQCQRLPRGPRRHGRR